ncbi:MAG: DNA alkylation repair protein [Planctomycetaceae bacterium]|nr:DNA alkylation repair protein [Planctomycetaceae bacterium]
MNETQLYEDIIKYCLTHADPDVVLKYKRYFKEGYDAYGLSDKLFKDKVDAVLARPGFNLKLALDTGAMLVQSGKYEETSFAIVLLTGLADQFDKKTFKAAEKWFRSGIVNWAHCDIFCGRLMTEFFNRGIITLDDIFDWRASGRTYQRRAVPVSMLCLLKIEKNFKPLFQFIEPLMLDPEEKVQQGLGWFLREAWKLQPKPTETFLLKWKDRAPRTIIQYATEKMSPEDKQRFKRTVTRASRP